MLRPAGFPAPLFCQRCGLLFPEHSSTSGRIGGARQPSSKRLT